MSSQVRNLVYVLTSLLVITPATLAQSEKNSRARQTTSAGQSRQRLADPRFSAGAMFDDEMIQAAVKRFAHDLSVSVGMDADTSEKVRVEVEQRWVPFLQQNRDEIAPLVSRFYSAAIDPDPPEIDEVKIWAKDALNLYDKVMSEMDKMDQDIVKHLSPAQIQRYKVETGKTRLGLGLFRGQLVKWESGDFDYSEWGRQQSARDRRRRVDSAKSAESLAESTLESPELTLVTMSAWDKYVAEFIKKYNLDQAQKSSANSILADVKSRASQYVKKHETEIDQLRKKLQSISAVERPAAAREQQELLKPLEELFAELKKRLDALPTDAQRTKATSGIQVTEPAQPESGNQPSGESKD